METGKDKVKKICDILRRDTLEPAQLEAEAIVTQASQNAEQLIQEAKERIQQMERDAAKEIEKQKMILHSSLSQACKQVLESLKLSIEEKLFNPELMRVITDQMQEPKIIAHLIEAVVKSVEKEGVEANLSVYIPAVVSAKSVNLLLAEGILHKLREKSVLLGSLTGGIEVKLHQEKMTVDMSDAALKEMLIPYIRKDFRELFFSVK